MKDESLPIPAEALHALDVARACFGKSLLATYLHGSAVAGGLRPTSDVDLLVVVDRATAHGERKQLVSELMKISGRHPVDAAGRRPLELIVFCRADLEAPTYPARCEFVYGEWLRAAFEAGQVPGPVRDPELTLLLAQARQAARRLTGPEPAHLLPVIPRSAIRRAIGDALPTLLSTLDGDERNVLLTLTRMWRTLATGEFAAKDVAAQWAMPRLDAEAADLLAHACAAYRGKAPHSWQARPDATRRVAGELGRRVAQML